MDPRGGVPRNFTPDQFCDLLRCEARRLGELSNVMPHVQQSKTEIVSLTSLRGIAAWWVVFYHGSDLPFYSLLQGSFHGWLPRGYLAVDLFFVLSGFIIARSYGDQFRVFSFGSYLKFLWLRLARIYPLHLFVMVLYLSVPVAILVLSSRADISGRFDPAYYLFSLLLIQNWGFLPGLDWNVPAWSISTEWMAYILFPGLLAVAGLAARVRLLGVLLVGLLVVTAAVFARVGQLGWDIEHFGVVRCVLEFWVGLCLYHLTPADPSRLLRWGALLAFVALCLAHTGPGAPDYLVMPAAFVCLVFALCRDDGPFAAVLAMPVLHWLGTISYSTYLVHYFVREWVKFGLVRDGIPPSLALLAYVAATLAGSAVLYRWVEVPGRTAMRGLIATRAPEADPAPRAVGRAPGRPTRERPGGEPGHA